MSHIIIIIGEKLDCAALAFPSIANIINDLKAKAIEADKFLLSGEHAGDEDIHEKLEEIQSSATDWCDNSQNFESEDVKDDCMDFIEDLSELLE